ncbi:hypothetical protein AB9F41_01000 [Rhizobium leguminosarum]|uniref:hypothetical protein n=1 Tax=Rhizobium leguminosarum TaxID=384 RepID=UPI003F9CB05B
MPDAPRPAAFATHAIAVEIPILNPAAADRADIPAAQAEHSDKNPRSMAPAFLLSEKSPSETRKHQNRQRETSFRSVLKGRARAERSDRHGFCAPHFSIHDFTELTKNRNNSVKQPAHEAVGVPPKGALAPVEPFSTFAGYLS